MTAPALNEYGVPLTAPPVLPTWLDGYLSSRQRARPEASGDGQPIPEGGRDSYLASLAGTMRKRGMTGAEIHAALVVANTDRCQPPLDERDVARIAASVSRYPGDDPILADVIARVGSLGDGPGGIERRTLRMLDTRRMLTADPPPLPWLIEPMLLDGMLTLLYGREGHGKSLLAMGLAGAVATGEPVAGMVPGRAARVLYIDAENGEREMHRRMRAIGLEPEHAEAFMAVEATGFDLRRDLAELDALLMEHRPALIVLDSFRSLWGGKENDSESVAPVLDALRNLIRDRNAACLLLHHSGKLGSEYRGSTAIGGSAEFTFQLGKAEDDDDTARRFLHNVKARAAAEAPRRWLRLGAERGMVLIDETEAPEGEEPRPVGRPSTVSHELAPRILAALGGLPDGETMTLADVCRACGKDPKTGSVRRVLDSLADAGEVERNEAKGYRLGGRLPGV